MQKNIINISKYKLTALIIMCCVISSCKKFLDNGVPPNAIAAQNAFIDSAAALSSVLALYSVPNITVGGNSGQTILVANTIAGSMSADDGYFLTTTTYDNFKNNTLVGGNSQGNLIWEDLYKMIFRANNAIKYIPLSTGLTASLKNQLLGESKFWRAWYYFYLVNYFGDVPLVTNPDDAIANSQLPRTSTNQIYQLIVSDLTDAKNMLTTTYPSTQRARVNKNAVSALLARVYFYQQNWAGAEAEATNVIGTGTYSLETFNNSFINASNETILQAFSTTGVTALGVTFVPASITTPTFVLYDTLAKTFETGDLRKTNWTKSIVYSSKTYYYPFKYKLRSGTTGNEFTVLLRLAEMYLIRAEARAQQSNIAGAQADINAIRTRAGLANTTAATQATLLSTLEHERWVEMFAEYGDRWFNLKRLNKADAVLALIKPGWQSYQKLYPIPTFEITANRNLVQNPGY